MCTCIFCAEQKMKGSFGRNKGGVTRKRFASDYALDRTTSYFSNSAKTTPSRQKPSDYVKTLLSPHTYKGMKIPDLACYPSTTYCEDEHVTWQYSGTSGGDLLFVGLTSQCFYSIVHSTTDATPSTFGTQANILTGDMSSRFGSSRLVSAEAKVTFIGNGDNNQGLISCAYVPYGKVLFFQTGVITPGVTSTVGNMDASILNIKDYNDSYTGPLKNGASVYYKPVDSNSFAYKPVFGPTTGRVPSRAQAVTPGIGSGNSASSMANFADGWGYFVFAIDGQSTTAGAALFDVKITLNFEALPTDDDTDYVMSASPTNSNSIDVALAIASATPLSGDANSAAERLKIAKLVHDV